MANSNHSIRPPLFEGNDDQNAEEWMDSYERYAEFVEWNDRKKLTGFKSLLQGKAARWLKDINDRIIGEDDREQYTCLKEQFLLKFQLSGPRKFQMRTELNKIKQKVGEDIETYLSRIEKLFHQLQISEDNKLHYFIQGLQDSIQAHVLRMQPENFEGAINAARAEEGAQAVASREVESLADSIVEKLTAKVNALQAKLDSGVSATQQPPTNPYLPTHPVNYGYPAMQMYPYEQPLGFAPMQTTSGATAIPHPVISQQYGPSLPGVPWGYYVIPTGQVVCRKQ